MEADKTKAQEWYEKSLKAMLVVEDRKENTYLEYRIGKMYQYGLGTEENLPEAAKWFEIASGKEHKYALYSLGMLYRRKRCGAGRGKSLSVVSAFP